jgi:hypothetical protein
VQIVATFTLGSLPAVIDGGELRLTTPAGWTVVGVSSDASSTCDTTTATITFDAAAVVASGLRCATGDKLVLDISAQTPSAAASTVSSFSASLKTRPGGRRRYNNVWEIVDPTVTVAPAALPAAPAAAAGFVERSGNKLTLDGSAYRFTGLNVYNANSRNNCGPSIDLGAALDAWGGGKEVVRAWFFQSLATSNGARDWSAFDQTLATARAHGYRVIVTLANQWADCDQGYGYKTDAWYRSGYKGVDPSGTVSYRDFVAEIVARYKDDPTILMWQLMNEAEDRTSQNGSCPTDAATVLKSWATDVSGLVKSIDPNHLVSLGTLGGGTCGASFTQYQSIHDIPTIDVCEVHDYGHPDSPMPGDQWNGMQAEINFCNNLNKPLFVGEMAIATEESLQARAGLFRAKLTAQFGAGVVGEVAWLWSPHDSIGYDIGPGDPALDVLGSF